MCNEAKQALKNNLDVVVVATFYTNDIRNKFLNELSHPAKPTGQLSGPKLIVLETRAIYQKMKNGGFFRKLKST